MNSHDFRAGDRRHSIERERMIAAARMGGISSTDDARIYFLEKRNWSEIAGMVFCLLSAGLVLGVLAFFSGWAWGLW